MKVDGVDISFGDVATGLETRLLEFRAQRAALDRARKGVGESKVLLDRALDEFRGSFPWIAQALEAFARMAGERELADRIRTSIRRVTRRQGEGEEEPDPAPTEQMPAAETSADETPSETSSDAAVTSAEMASKTGTASADSTASSPVEP